MKCKKCGKIVYESNEIVEVSSGYSYYCNECDEDKYSFEVEPASKDELLTELINLIRANEHFAIYAEQGIETQKDKDIICEEFNLQSKETFEILTESQEMIDNICKYIKRGE